MANENIRYCPGCGSPLTGAPEVCPVCGSPLTRTADAAPLPASPRQATPARKVGPWLYALVLLGGLVLFYLYVNPSIHPVLNNQPVVAEAADYDSTTITMTEIPFAVEGDDIVFSLDAVKKYRLVRFSYPTPTIERPVMAYIAPDGRLVTAISVSDHCGSTEFTIKDNQIFCARCPSHWDILTMEAYACCQKYYPDPVPSRVSGTQVLINKDDVAGWAGRL